MEIIGGIQVSGSIDIYEGVLRTIEASGSFSGSGRDLYDLQADAIVGLNKLATGSVTASVNQTDGFIVVSVASGSTFSGNVKVISGSFSGSGANLYDISASSIIGLSTTRIASGSATASLNFNVSGSSSFNVNTNTFITGALLVTGAMTVYGDVKIFGTQSVEYITSSQLNIGTNIITVNTDTPALRFGGIAVYDSGSTARTGSLLWDSQRNNWIYTNPSGSVYDGGVVMMGPTNESGSGNEQTINQFAVVIGEGNHHLTSSALIVSQSKFISSIPTIISQSLSVTGTYSIVGNSTLSGSLHLFQSTSVSGTNIFGTASFSQTASYVDIRINREWHVSSGSGDDTIGDGTLLNPFKTLGKASSSLGNTGERIILHPGTYTENVTFPQLNFAIGSPGEAFPGEVLVNGTLTFTGASSSNKIGGISINSIVQSGNGNLYMSNVSVNTSITKTGTGYMELNNCSTQTLSGNTITGAGTVVFNGGKTGVVIQSNASSIVSLLDLFTAAQPIVNSGTMLIKNSIVYALTNGGNALSASAASVVQLQNSQFYNPAGTNAKIVAGGLYGLDDVSFDRPSSTLGSSLVARAHFQAITADQITGSIIGTSSFATTASYVDIMDGGLY